MKKKMKQLTAIVAVTALAVAALTGCGSSKVSKKDRDPNVITYWSLLDGNTSQTAATLAETEFAKKLMEETGCTIEYEHPASGQGVEKFSILTASNNLPDIIEFNWALLYPGGTNKALEDGIIQALDIKKDAPNLSAYLEQNPDIDRLVTTDDGKYPGFPFIRGDKYLLTYCGPVFRQDWLNDLNLEAPETIDEWTNVLRAFKDKKGAVAPLTTSLTEMNSYGVFSGAYGTYYDLYLRDGKVTYGPLDDSYKDYLALLNKWYEEGLLDAEFATVDGSIVQSNLLNNICGATVGSCGGGMGKWLAAAPNDKFDLVGAKYPVLNKGEVSILSQYEQPVSGIFAAISRDCDNYEACTKLLDYAYSEEGHMLFNFGIEGESYNMIDGYPTYTEEIINSSEGLSMAASMARYCRSHNSGAFVQDRRYMEQYSTRPQQKAALDNWLQTDVQSYFMPPLNLTTSQETEMASVEEGLNTYRDQMMMKFITGGESLDKFDEFREGLKKRGVDKYVKYHQEAYDKFMKK